MYFPFFRAGQKSSTLADSLPLALIAGSLIMDSGEAERTFIFRCQDRYLTFNSLLGLRSILFVANEEHCVVYRELIRSLSSRLRLTQESISQTVPEIPEPFFVPCDIDRLTVEAHEWFLDSLQQTEIAASRANGVVYLNQVSPSAAELLTQLNRVLRSRKLELPINTSRLRELGDLALAFHNKARYVELVRKNPEGLPSHATTAILSPQEFLDVQSWEDLTTHYVSTTGDEVPTTLYVKSSLDSGGNVAARLSKENFADEAVRLKREVRQFILWQDVDQQKSLSDLREEIDLAPTLRFMEFSDTRLAQFRKLQRAQRIGIEILVQREVSDSSKDLFDSIGITCDIRGLDEYRLITAAPQFYADAERRHYIGSYLSDSVTKTVMTSESWKQVERLLGLFAELGYRGPINFDARFSQGEYVFLFDCNPRLSAVYPALALQTYLRKQGLKADSVLTLGYRGEFVYRDIGQTLAHLASSGVLYTKARQRGVVLLPNLSRDYGVDAGLVNMERSEIEDLISSGVLQATVEPGALGRPAIF